MPNNPSEEPFLPAFCRPAAVFFVVLICELVALLLVLSNSLLPAFNWQLLGTTSLFVQWLGLASAGLLCAARPLLLKQSLRIQIVSVYLVILGVSAICGFVSSKLLPGPEASYWRVVRMVLMSAIVAGLGCRYFWLQYQHRLRRQAHLTATIDALQARIRPHFMFNALNSIAGMISLDAQKAEAMTLDFAELMRASGKASGIVPLEQELQLCRQYVALEKIRFGERLAVDWRVEAGLNQVQIPNLLIQPLIENAIYHGIQQRADGGSIDICICRLDAKLAIYISNPLPVRAVTGIKGQQLAVDNIRHRLSALYGVHASYQVDLSESQYKVVLLLPLQQASA